MIVDLVRQRDMPVAEAWARLTTWQRHGEYMPLTRVTVSDAQTAVGTRVVAHTGVGPLSFVDPMEVLAWHPPADGLAHCRLVKRGSFVRGWAQVTVTATPSGGSLVHWHEEATLPFEGRLLSRLAHPFGRLLFAHLVDRLLG